jgi:hypothetical protein
MVMMIALAIHTRETSVYIYAPPNFSPLFWASEN